jgi:hypothetical protein
MPTDTPIDIALDYIRRGWAPIPIPFRQKGPTIKGWQEIRATVETASRYFNGGNLNVGVLLGEASHDLIDCDLDCLEAIAVAGYLLPLTKAAFGRASKRFSHLLFYSDGLPAMIGKAAAQFKDPSDGLMLLEIRCGGGGHAAQSVFPGSVHKSGERVAWEDRYDQDPARVDGAELLKAAKRTAAAALIAKHWPSTRGLTRRLRLGGLLARCGFNESEGKLFAEAIAKAVGAEVAETVRIIRACIVDYAKGARTLYGMPAFIDAFGKPVALKCAEWLGYAEGASEREAEAEQQAATTLAGAAEKVEAAGDKAAEVLVKLARDGLPWRDNVVQFEPILRRAAEQSNIAKTKIMQQIASDDAKAARKRREAQPHDTIARSVEHSDDAVALAFIDRHGAELRYVAKWGQWLKWTGSQWQEDATLDVWDKVRKVAREDAITADPKTAKVVASGKTAAAVEKLSRADRRVAMTFDQFDSDDWLLNCPSGVVDLKTGTLRPHQPQDYRRKWPAARQAMTTALCSKNFCPR